MDKQSELVTRLQSALAMPASVTWAQSLSVPSLCGAKVRLVVTATNQSLLLPPRSVSLIECGPVHTAFFEKLEGGPGGTLEHADAQTRHLFTHYQRNSYEQALSEAQDPEEVIEVGANGGLLAQSPGGAWRCTPPVVLPQTGAALPAAALSDRAASPAASPALLLHPPLPASDPAAHRGSQWQQLRRCHAPRDLR